MALLCPAWASPMNSQFFLPTAVGRMVFSTMLLSICLAALRFDLAAVEVDLQVGSEVEGVVDGFTDEALG